MSMMDSLIDNPALLDRWISPGSALPDLRSSSDLPALAERRATIARHLQAMDSLSSDCRIRYLAEHGLAEAQIRQLLNAIYWVINKNYGETIRQMAIKHAQRGSSLADLVADISDTNIIHELADVCYRNPGEHAVIAAAYANHEFYYTANAALNLAMLTGAQADAEPDCAPQCVERDRMLADVGLTEDARLWPES